MSETPTAPPSTRPAAGAPHARPTAPTPARRATRKPHDVVPVRRRRTPTGVSAHAWVVPAVPYGPRGAGRPANGTTAAPPF
ncbi:hypothetical protein [Yinghuangia seranimata]|uniref:hypothetical protein n=1 Tax=Yinghuangia seranimata TaxID=408067 RepID=UPI00248D3301|nr:hypothetical protein [Yinghuangia seranimata]MDI2129699.1 hypothetical protein [Yinghuangia seranimata]